MPGNNITQERLREVLSFDEDTGVFTWIKSTGYTSRYVGRKAGNTDRHGHIWITINNECYSAHRLAWFWVNGEWPPAEIDHRDLDPSNNRLSNLRLATHSQNMRNTTLNSRNTSGFKGVSFSKQTKKWKATIGFDGTQKHLGFFVTPEAAHAAYATAAAEIFGEFARSV